MTDALRVLRERYQTTSATTVAAFRRLAAQLAITPGALELIETLRRELHRVHGSAGSYGFPEASRLAAGLEERAIRWASEPALDRDRRGAITELFANELQVMLSAARGTTGDRVPAEANAPAMMPVASAPSAVPPPATPAARSNVPDLIVVEDDPALVDMLRYALETAGFSFHHYATGPAALTALMALQTGDQRPLILLDVDLPGLDGFSLHERLRVERPGVYQTVFLTARSGEAEQLRAYRAGAIDYLAKPVSLRILMVKIPTWLNRPRDHR